MNESVIAVIVTYHPNLEHLGRLLDELNAQVATTVVIDNGSGEEFVSWISNRGQSGNVKLIGLESNFGVAYAQNRGIEIALEANAGFVLLMDQDSLPLHNMVSELRANLAALTRKGQRVAAVGPVCVTPADGSEAVNFLTFDRLPPSRNSCISGFAHIETDILIASGMLIPSESFRLVGMMDESLFVDQVDTDWCLRARDRGLVLFGICSAKLVHTIGLGNTRIWIGRWRTVATHSPIRNYYYVRNSLVLLRRPYTPVYWRIFTVYFVAKWLLRTVFMTPRLLRIQLISRGLADGLLHRLGPLR